MYGPLPPVMPNTTGLPAKTSAFPGCTEIGAFELLTPPPPQPLKILDKINKGLPGYEGISGRYASYFLGYLMQNRYRDMAKAKNYYQRCLVFAESTGDTSGGFYLFANMNLARLAVKDKDLTAAKRYFNIVADKADHKSEQYKEAKAWLKKNDKA